MGVLVTKLNFLTKTASGITATYSYDDNGNMVSKIEGGNATIIYSWDWQNRLAFAHASGYNTVYQYNGDGVRTSKTQGGVKTKYINDLALPLVQVLMETDDANTVEAIYTYGNDLISMNRADANSYYHYDGLGTARKLTDDSGDVAASYTFDSFGNSVDSESSVANAYGFTGEQQFNEADELVFLRARYYKPSIGRFINRDPIGYGDGMNLYSYVRNNTVNFVDPSGMKVSNCERACSAMCGAALGGIGFCIGEGWPGAVVGGAVASLICGEYCDQVCNTEPPWHPDWPGGGLIL